MIDGTATNTSVSLHAKAWAEEYTLIDSQLSPLGLQAMDALNVVLGETVVDVGCRTGHTLLQLAERVGEQGRIYGVDISGPLLTVAAKRSSHLKSVQLIESDAATLDLPDKADAVFSRFGIMSFYDPVAAFSNFHRLLKPHGRLRFCCWRALQDNELDRFPLAATGFADAADQTPFSFSDPEHIRNVLVWSGFNNIAIRPHDEAVTSGDVETMTRVLTKVGPLGKIVRESPSIRSVVEPKLRKALASFDGPSDVRLNASVWIVAACV